MQWQKIPRKLRAGLVQIGGRGIPTISKETEKELNRRGWISDGWRTVYKRGYGGQLIEIDDEYMSFVLSFEGQRIFDTRSNRDG